MSRWPNRRAGRLRASACGTSASRWRSCWRRTAARRSTPPSASTSTTSRCPRSPRRWTRLPTWRRSCTPMPRETCAFAGSAATRRRSSARSRRLRTRSELQLHNNRLAGCAIEPRAAIALPGSDGDSLTLYSATQVPHFVRRLVAEQLGMAELAIRVDRPRRRRRLRLQGQALSRGDDRRVGGAPAAPPGALGGDAHRELRLRQPGARPFHALRAGARCGRPLPRAPRRDRGESRRLRVDGRRGDPERDLHRPARRRLCHAGDPCVGHGGVHEHRAHRRVSRRRPAGGLLRPRAPCRRGRAPARHRPGGDPPPQPRARVRHAVQDADRTDLRLRRLSAHLRARARARRLRRIRRASRDRVRARRPARRRHRVLRRVVRRRPVEARRGARRARGVLRVGGGARRLDRRGAGVARHAQPRAGSRHHVRAGPRLAPRHAAREDPHRRRRHGRGAIRHRHLRLALARGRRVGAPHGRAQDHRERPAHRGAPARGGGRGRRLRATGASW